MCDDSRFCVGRSVEEWVFLLRREELDGFRTVGKPISRSDYFRVAGHDELIPRNLHQLQLPLHPLLSGFYGVDFRFDPPPHWRSTQTNGQYPNRHHE